MKCSHEELLLFCLLFWYDFSLSGLLALSMYILSFSYPLLGSFNGPEPGGPESTIRKGEREREKDTGTQALMEQRCFNELSVSICRLLYKEFLLTVIKIRKRKVQQPLPREQGMTMVIRSGDNPYLKKGSRLSSFVVRRMFTEGDSYMSHPMTSVLGAVCRSTHFCCQKLIRNRGFMRNST